MLILNKNKHFFFKDRKRVPRNSLIVSRRDCSSLCCLALAPTLYSSTMRADIRTIRPRLLATNTRVAVFRSGYRSIFGK